MKNRSGEKIKLTSIDELLGVVNEESAMEIEINRIHAFKNHPFKVLDDEKMADLIESVKVNGVLTPVLLRSDGEDGYETVSYTHLWEQERMCRTNLSHFTTWIARGDLQIWSSVPVELSVRAMKIRR